VKFELSDDQALLRTTVRAFLAGEFPLETTRRLMEHDARGYDPAAWRRLADMGVLGLTVPAGAGGQGLGPIELAIVGEEMGRVCAPGPYLDVVLAVELLTAAGEQETLLAEVCEGKRLVTIARDDAPFAGEPGSATHCRGGRIEGRKFFVPFAATADALLVTTVEGIHLVRAPFDVTPLPTLDLAARFGEVRLSGPATPCGASGLLERVDRLAAVGAAAILLGLMSRALETTLAYVQTREAFRRPIGSFQALQHRLAEMLLRTESTRSAVYRAAWCLATADPAGPLAAAAAKAYAGEAARLVCGEAIQMHGGIGFTWELDLHFLFKRAKTLEMHYGSTETQLERALGAAGF
jgi:alkylation response protein AidB-like acyl-CoA dehydrogenase